MTLKKCAFVFTAITMLLLPSINSASLSQDMEDQIAQRESMPAGEDRDDTSREDINATVIYSMDHFRNTSQSEDQDYDTSLREDINTIDRVNDTKLNDGGYLSSNEFDDIDEEEANDYEVGGDYDGDDDEYDDGEKDFESDDFDETKSLKVDKKSKGPPAFAIHVKRNQRISRNKVKPWPNATIPFLVFGSNKTQKRVKKVLNTIQKKTCLNFMKRKDEERYLVIKEDDGGCWTSSVGYPSSDKKVIVGLGKGCRNRKGITHEILHGAGFLHEHNRPDRQQYISIKWNLVSRRGRPNFRLDYRYSLTNLPYDYNSIMHYGKKAFSTDSTQPTIIPKKDYNGKIGGSKLSALDIQKINTFYHC